MSRRFYVPAPELVQGADIVLSEAESRHAAGVLRLQPGDAVELLDGRGGIAQATVESLAPKRVAVRINHIERVPAPVGRIVLAVGRPKSARKSILLEKIVELNADALWLFDADRTQGRGDEDASGLIGPMIAALKQSGAPRLPEVRMFPKGLFSLLEAAKDFDRGFVLDFDAPAFAPDELGLCGTTLLVVGPEGGLTERERNLCLGSGLKARTLGEGVLRFETAALAALSLFFWGRTLGCPAKP